MNSIILSILIVHSGGMRITEIMSDPEPAAGLPPHEYVEWFNPGPDTVDLAGWQWVVGDRLKRVQAGRVAPGGYVIVCSPSAADALRPFGQVIPLESFPALRNTGDRLTLVDPQGMAVQSVSYSPYQFTDALKANGGWSLELADATQYCNPSAWLPSIDPSGGTPGRENSQSFSVPPAEPPLLIRAAGYEEDRFMLLFTGALDPAIDMNKYSCRLFPGNHFAPPLRASDYGINGLFFQIPDSLNRSLVYTVELSGDIAGCSGQPALLRPVMLGFPVPPDSAGVVISEVMFDPGTGQTEFVEIFNRSARVIDLKDLILARADTTGEVASFSGRQDLSYWLFPGCYAVFAASESSFGRGWPSADPAVVAERQDMPSLTNEKSVLILMDRNQKRLDVVVYSPDWHYSYLDDSKGISLERVDVNLPGFDRSNWFSATPATGGSSPGSKNSTIPVSLMPAGQHFSLDPVIGYSSLSTGSVQASVRYNFEEAGWFMRMHIYDQEGLPVKELFPFGLSPAEGIVLWDGLDDAQRLVPDGIYIIVADYYHPSGGNGRWKKACAVLRTY